MKKLERRLGIVAVVSICVSSMLGSGIFVLPALAVEITGPSLWLAYFLSAVAVIPAATSKAELATAMPASGGTYVYLERTFGPLVGTIAGFGLWFSLLLKSAFALIGIGAYLSIVADIPIKPLALALLIVIVFVNVLGVGKVSRALFAIVTLSIGSLLGLMLIGQFSGNPVPQGPFFKGGYGSLLNAAGLVFVSFAGVTKIAAIAGEVKDPHKNLPRGIFISLALVTVMYCLVSYGLTKYLTIPEISGTLRPIHVLAEKIGGTGIGMFFGLVAILTMGSMANAGVLAASRFPFVMSRESIVPRMFGHLNKKYLTPDVSIVVSGLLVASSIILLDVVKVAKLASAFVIALYMMENITVLIIREIRVKWYQPTYKAPLYPYMQIFGILSGLYLLIQMGLIVLTSFAIIGGTGALIYIIYGRHRAKHKGVVGIRIKRKDMVQTLPMDPELEAPDLPNHADTVVALFGTERSTESLIEFAGAIGGKGKIEVAYLTEVPGQTDLRDLEDEPVHVKSLVRRIRAIEENTNVDIRFDPVVSHDIYHTINEISRRVHCKWLIKEWGGKTHGLMTVNNQMGWLEEHLDCHVATYRDAGIRYLKKFMVVIKHGRHDNLVVETSDHLAAQFKGELVFIRTVSQNTTESEKRAEEEYLKTLVEAVDSPSSYELLVGENLANSILEKSCEFDLVVLGAPHRSRWGKYFGTEMDKIIENASCSVVTLQATIDSDN